MYKLQKRQDFVGNYLRLSLLKYIINLICDLIISIQYNLLVAIIFDKPFFKYLNNNLIDFIKESI